MKSSIFDTANHASLWIKITTHDYLLIEGG